MSRKRAKMIRTGTVSPIFGPKQITFRFSSSIQFISRRFFSFFVSFADYYLGQTFCWHHISKNQKSIFAYPYQSITKSLEFNSDKLLLQISWKKSKDQKHLKDRFASDEN